MRAFGEGEQAAVVAYFHDLLVDRSLDLRLVIVIREELLGRMAPLEQTLPGLLDVRYRVDRLTREAAREAVESPAQRFGVGWAPTLMQRVLSDLQEGESQLINPSQLQIVCQHLFQVAVAGNKQSLTLADLEAEGGTATILGGFLDEAIATLDPTQQSLAKTLLGALVTSGGDRQRLPAAELARYLGGDSADDLAQLQPLLDLLISRSLVRRIVPPTRPVSPLANEETTSAPPLAPPAYELSHDYLAAHIIAWLGEDFWATQRAREILRVALPDWLARGRLLPAGDLDLVTSQHGLLRPTPDEARLLFASAVAYVRGIDRWQPGVPGPDQRNLLLALTQHGDATVRARAVTRLDDFSDAEVGTRLAELALDDEDADVREAAARAVALLSAPVSGDPGHAGPTAVGLLAKSAQGADAGRALTALTLAGNMAPVTRSMLPKELASTVQRRVWGERFRRKRAWILAGILRGLQGGLWGLGLGIGPYLGLSGLNPLYAQRFESVLVLATFGLPFMGVIGAISTALVATAGVIPTALGDHPVPRRTWAVQTGVGVVALAVLYAIFSVAFSFASPLSGAAPVRAMLAGGLMGLGFFGAATAPLPVSRLARLGICAAAGVLALFLTHVLGLVFPDNFPWVWILWTGAISGLGVGWGLRENAGGAASAGG